MTRIRLLQRLLLAVLILTVGGMLTLTQAQTATPAPTLSITGNLESISDHMLVVSGLRVDDSQVTPLPELTIGLVVQVTGTMSNGIIIASRIVVIPNDPKLTLTPAPTVTGTPPTPTPVMSKTPDPDATLTGTLTATPIASDDGTVIIIEGPVTQININIITIYNINIQVAPDDPILENLEIGDLVRVVGNMTFDDGVIVVVVINITYVNIVIINNPGGPQLPPNCKITPKGKLKCTPKHGKGKGNDHEGD